MGAHVTLEPGQRRRRGPGARAHRRRRRRSRLRDERPPRRPCAGLCRRAAGRPGQPARHARAAPPRWTSRATSSSRGSRSTASPAAGCTTPGTRCRAFSAPASSIPRPVITHRFPLEPDRRRDSGHQGRPGGQGDPGDRRMTNPLRRGASSASSSSSSRTASTSGSIISTARRRPGCGWKAGARSSSSPPTITWASATSPRWWRPARTALDRYGAGTASVRFICGTFTDPPRRWRPPAPGWSAPPRRLSFVSCLERQRGGARDAARRG